ncbi:GDSL esterase/lipase At5g03610-like [Aristolochia californica]|uniref:GDSL esterase/lipase At5g03610-like n=1 Tax=Aristolochia californica TaxID=171875 RepID=UPI0035D6E8C6
MEKDNTLFCFCVFLALLQCGIGVDAHRYGRLKLFVFGDSYADTGNFRKSAASSWKEPYGVTFPGRPTGRWSDGRVLTDFLASLLRIRSPLPYKWRRLSPKLLRYGMNYAYGGTGVFDTLVSAPNLTAQIELFRNMIEEGNYSKLDIQSSIALVSLAGNDYTAYQARNGSLQNVTTFVASVINQLALNLKQIQEIGVKKIAVTAIEPVGCLPDATIVSSYQKCNESMNGISIFHNLLLQKAVEGINNSSKNESTIALIDLYSAFMFAFRNQTNQGKRRFENHLKPCCAGIRPGTTCGSVDSSGAKLYTICDDPKSTFFWDGVHPSQGGWSAISSYLRGTLNQLYN